MKFLLLLAVLNCFDSQSAGKRMVFHNGKWKFKGLNHFFVNITVLCIIITVFSDITFSWPDKTTPESGKILATGLPMATTYKIRFEVLFRPDDSTHYRSIFHVTDGGKFGSSRCGGRIPGVWARNAAPPIRSGLFL